MVSFALKRCVPVSLAIWFAAFCCGSLVAQDYSSRLRNVRTDRAYQELLRADLFNFGGVGVALTITPGEKAFHLLMQSGKRVELLTGLLSEANPEGQLYALYGLYLEDPDNFKKEAERLNSEAGPPERLEGFIPVGKGKVRVAHGCLLFQQDRRAVIEEIAKGKFDSAFWSNHPRLRY